MASYQSHAPEGDISGTLSGNFFKCVINDPLDLRVNSIDFGGQTSKVAVTVSC